MVAIPALGADNSQLPFFRDLPPSPNFCLGMISNIELRTRGALREKKGQIGEKTEC